MPTVNEFKAGDVVEYYGGSLGVVVHSAHYPTSLAINFISPVKPHFRRFHPECDMYIDPKNVKVISKCQL